MAIDNETIFLVRLSSLVFLVNYFFIRSELSPRGKVIEQTSPLQKSAKRRMLRREGGVLRVAKVLFCMEYRRSFRFGGVGAVDSSFLMTI